MARKNRGPQRKNVAFHQIKLKQLNELLRKENRIDQSTVETLQRQKTSLSVYVDEEIPDRLEEMVYRLREQVSPKLKERVNRSTLIGAVLKLALVELETQLERGEEPLALTLLLQNQDKKQ